MIRVLSPCRTHCSNIQEKTFVCLTYFSFLRPDKQSRRTPGGKPAGPSSLFLSGYKENKNKKQKYLSGYFQDKKIKNKPADPPSPDTGVSEHRQPVCPFSVLSPSSPPLLVLKFNNLIWGANMWCVLTGRTSSLIRTETHERWRDMRTALLRNYQGCAFFLPSFKIATTPCKHLYWCYWSKTRRFSSFDCDYIMKSTVFLFWRMWGPYSFCVRVYYYYFRKL